MRLGTIIVALLAILIPASSVVAQPNKLSSVEVVVRSVEDITVCKGDYFVISVEQSFSTAYDFKIRYWHKKKLKLVQEWEICDPPAPGSSCEYYYKYKARRLGKARIIVIHSRPWLDIVYIDIYNINVVRRDYQSNRND